MSGFLCTTACAPTFLPVNDNDELDLNVIPCYFEYLYKSGIRSLFINGGCGEFSSITIIERKKILEKWIEIVTGDIEIIVNIGTTNLADTIELGNHALSLNKIYGLGIVPPFYMSINDENMLINYLMTVAHSLHKRVPILYYHIPSNSKVEINFAKFLDLIKIYDFSQLSAIKFTDSNSEMFHQLSNGIQSKSIGLNIYCGYEPLLEEMIKSGAKGAILGFVNINPKLINSVINGIKDEITKSNLDNLIKLFHAIQDYSRINRVNLIGLLKITTEFYSQIKLGPMKKPYNINNDQVKEFKQLLKTYNLFK